MKETRRKKIPAAGIEFLLQKEIGECFVPIFRRLKEIHIEFRELPLLFFHLFHDGFSKI